MSVLRSSWNLNPKVTEGYNSIVKAFFSRIFFINTGITQKFGADADISAPWKGVKI
jgi:hypothetical protein